tara:strand:+ start:48 stop:371 length:324 start_codon:yes stop_codon:yes gene_type:complete
MTKQNTFVLVIAILVIVIIWYISEQGIIGKKKELLGYSYGTLQFGDDVTYTRGCTDPSAENYDPDAAVDNGLCFYTMGCCDIEAQNYNPEADSCNVPNNNVLNCNYS